jgi:hypothetical protein
MKLQHLKKQGYLAYPLPNNVRSELLDLFPPKYDRVVAHHVTYEFDVPSSAINQVPQHLWSPTIVVVGYQDINGVEALVVEVEGTTIRKDGKIYHITWSLSPGKKPMESNAMLSQHNYIILPTTKHYSFVSTIQFFN